MNEIRKEAMEALAAGEKALASLRKAEEQLRSAGNWGLVDLFGGGLVTDFIKHSKMNQAVSYMEQAKHDLHIFKREVKDVQLLADVQLDVGSFLTFADFFFDGLIADYLVQSKISDAKRQVETAIRQVDLVMVELRSIN